MILWLAKNNRIKNKIDKIFKLKEILIRMIKN